MPIWLSIDFDYFVPDCEAYDEGHAESAFFKYAMWPIRASNRILSGNDPRNKPLDFGGERPETFFADLRALGFRFRSKDLQIADSHAFGSNMVPNKGAGTIINFDAHHDMGYSEASCPRLAKGVNACDDWLLMSLLMNREAQAHLVYPEWKQKWSSWDKHSPRALARLQSLVKSRVTEKNRSDEHLRSMAGIVTRVFICKSGAWTPPWYDQAFADFVKQAEAACGKQAVVIGNPDSMEDPRPLREMSWETADALAAQMLALRNQYEPQAVRLPSTT